MNHNADQDLQIQRYDDEISLNDLYRTLVKRKLILIAVFTITVLTAILYLLMAQPTYEAKIKLLLPNTSSLFLSRPEHPYAQFDSKIVFEGFQARLKRKELWRLFVAKNPQLFPPAPDDRKVDILSEHPIHIGLDKSYPAEHIEISYKDHTPKLSADILRGYLKFTYESYVAELLSLVKGKIERRKESIMEDIALLREKEKLDHKDEIERLRRDLSLAKTLGIEKSHLCRADDLAQSNGANIIVTNETMRSYMRGTIALEAELASLTKRESNDPDIYGLNDKKIELERLNNLRMVLADIRLFTQDGEIVDPQEPIKPKKRIIIAVAILLGLMLGVFAAFFTEIAAKFNTNENVTNGDSM